ncbi:MAG: fumarate hydratase, partial [Candidatus Latescibacteria bacterium]|nr:fumarate hydratase [Candidatus Latescibacterota bacterium]
MSGYTHHELLPLGKDESPYRLLTADHVSTVEFEGHEILKVDAEGLALLADQAIRDASHLLRPGHLAQVRKIFDDPEASDNDRFVALDLLKNANIAAGWVLPMCQDTGTAIVMGKKGHRVWTDGDDESAISAGIARAYRETNLRYSQMAPLTMFEEQNTGTNLPAQIELFATKGDDYKLMFMTKGGGSANKSYLFQETRALLT